MNKMVNAKNRLVSAVLVLVMMFTSLIGTTFAWFTDEVTSSGNTIQSGTLKIDLLHKSGDQWISLKENEDHKVFDYDKWEPGFTLVETLKVDNLGSLALKYRLSIEIAAGTAVLGENGENLADVIDVWVYYGESTATAYTDITATDSTWVNKGTLTEVLSNPKDFIGGQLTKDGEQTVTVALYMHELAGNEYQDLSVGEIYVNLIATQYSAEYDSFGNDYDENANYPVGEIYYTASAYVGNKIDADGKLTDDVAIGNPESGIYTIAPRGVKLADGATTLVVTIDTMEQSESNVSATHRSQVVRSFDVHVAGVADDNDVATVTYIESFLPAGLNSNNVMLYHVEDGVTNSMTIVSDPANHNEFSYDPLTGDAVVALAGYSEIVSFGDTAAEWDGVTIATSFAGGTGTENDPYVIANAEQFVYFRNEVDGGRTFEGEFIKLTANIDLNGNPETGANNFDPIGWGYDYDGFTAGGKTFNGTFDGNNKTIYGLYQNGWNANDCGNTYDYSMAGGGLFASVVDATIMNLTISGADIVMECIDMGVVAGYAQGNCNFQNISIINCTIQNYNRYTGGVVGECSPRYDENGAPLHSNHLFEDITVDSTTVVSSLWGSFDTSLGGILGGKWDKNGAETKVTMRRCNVACTIDAFNDVTSAYQWYAYRRAGMLVGNTEQSADHKALANFLTCTDVYVYYGEWNNYHYCEFENQSGSEDAAWQNNYPWVRVESGLSCNAYSNPRYGHPIVNGTPIVDSIHSHEGDDQCMVSLPFAQLYGGGQGVYGATTHVNPDGSTDGVKEGAYTVTYINYGETIKVEFVGDNTEAHTLWNAEEFVYGDTEAMAWVDGNGKEITSIEAGNTKNYILYPKFRGEYTIRFFDAEGNVVYFETFKERAAHTLNTEAIEAARVALQNKVDASEKIIKISWDRSDLTKISKSEATKDIPVKAVYSLSSSAVTLTPKEDAAGNIISYQVTSVTNDKENVLVAIPPYVGTVRVEKVNDSAFAGFDNLHAVTIPTTITLIGTNALASTWSNGTFGTDKGETITVYYAGSYEEWQKITLADGWSDGVSADTRLFFLNGTNTVDFSQGYLQFVVDDSNWLGAVKKGHFEYKDEVPESFVGEYYKNCDCKVDGCSGNLRPDAKYWEAYVN